MDEKNLAMLQNKLRNVKIEGLIIEKDNVRVFEYLKNKKIRTKPAKVYSITKTVVSILIGILIDQGLIHDVHTPIHHFFPEYIRSDDAGKRAITIDHLLTMTSGLKWENHGEGGGALAHANHWVKFVLEQPLVHPPGEVFRYSDGSSHLLSAIIHQLSGLPTAAFAERYLFRPLKIGDYEWLTDPQGIHGGGYSLRLTLEDLVKLGTLYLQNGVYDKKQIVSPQWVERSQIPNQITERSDLGEYGYGYQWWTFRGEIAGKLIHYYYANGFLGQFIIIIPQLQLVACAKSQLQDPNEQSLPRLYLHDVLQSVIRLL